MFFGLSTKRVLMIAGLLCFLQGSRVAAMESGIVLGGVKNATVDGNENNQMEENDRINLLTKKELEQTLEENNKKIAEVAIEAYKGEFKREHNWGVAKGAAGALVLYAITHPIKTKDFVVSAYCGCRDFCVGTKKTWNYLFSKKSTPKEAQEGQMRPVLLKPAVIEIPKQAPVAATVRVAHGFCGTENRGSCVEEGLREGSGGSETR